MRWCPGRRARQWLLACAVIGVMLVLPTPAAAQEVVFVVRHAERADQSADSVLSAAGEARAAQLAVLLKDSGISRVFTSDLKRTIQTAAPLATALNLTPRQLPPSDYDALLAQVRASGARERVLIVGHSNTLPDILKRLGVAEPVTIGDMEYDNLFVVIRQDGPIASLVRLRF